MSDFDFSKLTPAQRALIANGGWHVPDARNMAQPTKRTVRKLIERGLVVEEIRRENAIFYIREYSVPDAVRAAYLALGNRGRS